MALVSFRQSRAVHTPFYADGRIIPGDAAIPGRNIKLGALVQELSDVGKDQVTVCKPGRNVDLTLVFGGKKNALMTSEMRGPSAYVDYYIKNFAANHAAELALRAFELIVHSSKGAAPGSGMVVLNEA